MDHDTRFEVIIIGGSYAGLSAAMALGRSLRKLLIIDSGLPCNRFTPHSHNFITHDGEKPEVIAAIAKEQVLKYKTVTFHNDFAIMGKRIADRFYITTKSGQEFNAAKLIFATGVKDIMPRIKGFESCWGISVIHCPYCHGYEFRNKNTGIMANGERAFHLASLVKNLTTNITLLTMGEADFNEEQRVKLHKHNIKINETLISEFIHENGNVKKVIFKDGNFLSFDAVYAAIPFEQQSNIPISLGCELAENGYLKVNPFQQTSTPGVYACGDNCNMMRSVANAVYSGNLTGAVVNKELTEEEF